MADFGTLFANAGKGNVKKAQKSGNDRITYLHYSKLVENPHQYRKFSQQDVEEMADLIAAAGKVLQPLLVRKTDADEYEIIAGHKRRAGVRFLVEERKLEKYSLIPCIVSTADDIQARFSVVGTNVRPVQTPFETLHEIEEMRELLTQYPEAFPDLKGGRMVERLAGQLHMARSTVSEYRKIANNLGEAGMEAMKGGLLDKSAALELASLPEEEQEQLLKNGILTYTEIKAYRKKLALEPPDGSGTAAQTGKGTEKDSGDQEENLHEQTSSTARLELRETEKKLDKPGQAARQYLDAAARHLVKEWNGWMRDDFSRRVTDVTTSPEEMKKKLEGQNRRCFFATEAGTAHIYLYDDYVQIWDEECCCVGDYDWFYLAAAIQSQWNVVSLEKARERARMRGETGTADSGGSPGLMPVPVKDNSWFVKEYFAEDGRKFLPQIMRIFREEKTLDGKMKAVKELISPEGGYGGGDYAFGYHFGSYSRGISFQADARAAETDMTYKEFTIKLLEIYNPWAPEWMAGEAEETRGPSRGMMREGYAEYAELLEDMPRFRIKDLKEYSQQLENELREYQEAETANGNPMPEKLMARQRMRVAGLRLLLKLETDRLTN